MTLTECLQRVAVVAEARSWLGTPYRHRLGIKSLGCDCAYYLIRVFQATGLMPAYTPPAYAPGLAAMKSGELFYASIVERFADRVPLSDPQPGDIILFRFLRATHGGIVDFWPDVLHAFKQEQCVVRSNLDTYPYLGKRVDSLWRPRYDTIQS